jgi:hypothetical protein
MDVGGLKVSEMRHFSKGYQFARARSSSHVVSSKQNRTFFQKGISNGSPRMMRVSLYHHNIKKL